ncbi:surface lipoprotein assembly modifier [Emcibacter sp.]|uniref:surface lipoprotein assembly modifier n=1 Tax=Emcibacter sp. TaxID=1979954 RepID=UPI002AA78F28|nr:surface lipoprotein assembly modifier [Emcibacter sp.]
MEKLILEGRLDEARQILAQVKGLTPDPVQEQFLAGQIAGLEKRYHDAIDIYRDILSRHPKLTRVRLELARALFEAGEDASARHHFELVLGEKLPPAVEQNVNRFLYEIRKRKRWQVRAYFAIAPDSNITAATDQDTVYIYGLPFDLSEDARETSGLGIIGSTGFDYFWPLSDQLKLKSGFDIYHTQYSKSQFNDTFLSGNIGPRFVFEKTALTPQFLGYYRWYGGEAYNHAYGGQLLAEHVLSSRWRLDGTLSWQQLEYDRDVRRNGHLASITTRVSYSLTSSSLLQFLVGGTWEETRAEDLDNLSMRLGVGYYKDFGRGVTLLIRPEVLLRYYDAVENGFAVETDGEDRKDTRYSLSVDLTKRDWSIWGFAPVFGYSYTNNRSNVGFYSYERHRFQLGLTRTF